MSKLHPKVISFTYHHAAETTHIEAVVHFNRPHLCPHLKRHVNAQMFFWGGRLTQLPLAVQKDKTLRKLELYLLMKVKKEIKAFFIQHNEGNYHASTKRSHARSQAYGKRQFQESS